MARVLVTRPEEAARKTMALVRSAGHEPLLAPVLAMRPLEVTGRPHAEVPWQAVLVTSRHAVSAAVRFAADLQAFAVGEGTAAALRARGVEPSAIADGDGGSLAVLVGARLEPAMGPLLHPTGEVRAAALTDGLLAAGFDYRPWPVYAADPVDALPPAIGQALAAGGIDAVTLHSPRSARLFIELLRRDGLASTTDGLVGLALSANVATAAAALDWRELRVAPRPDERGMAALLEELRH